MTLLPVSLRPGVMKNGTLYSAKNRWAVTDRVRWFAGVLQAIGGWSRATTPDDVELPALVTDPVTETVRDAYAWSDNSNSANCVFASNKGVYYGNTLTSFTNIVFAGLPPAANKPVGSTGYGTGPYGIGTYGTPRLDTNSQFERIRRWTFDAWGEDLLAAFNPNGSGLYSYTPGAPIMVKVPNAPTLFASFAVTPQRFVMVIGADGVYNKVRWSDREDREQWAPAITNEAGDIVLQTSTPLTAIGRIQNKMLILGGDAYVASYVDPPYVYGFELVARDCAPIYEKGVIFTDRFAIWIGERTFWIYDGTVRAIESDLIDWLVENIDTDNISKMFSVVNTTFSEVWWFFQSNNSDTGDVDSYISFDYLRNTWTHGTLDRSAGFDRGIYPSPLYISVSGLVYAHEQEGVIPDNAYAETGPLEIGNGDRNMSVRAIYQDTQAFGDVNITLFGRQIPTAPEFAYGPYPFNNPTPTRAEGREIRMRVDGQTLGWEVGTMRFDVVQGSGR
jgi:hypothetical protein